MHGYLLSCNSGQQCASWRSAWWGQHDGSLHLNQGRPWLAFNCKGMWSNQQGPKHCHGRQACMAAFWTQGWAAGEAKTRPSGTVMHCRVSLRMLAVR